MEGCTSASYCRDLFPGSGSPGCLQLQTSNMRHKDLNFNVACQFRHKHGTSTGYGWGWSRGWVGWLNREEYDIEPCMLEERTDVCADASTRVCVCEPFSNSL